jgi:hypothetical protein
MRTDSTYDWREIGEQVTPFTVGLYEVPHTKTVMAITKKRFLTRVLLVRPRGGSRAGERQRHYAVYKGSLKNCADTQKAVLTILQHLPSNG